MQPAIEGRAVQGTSLVGELLRLVDQSIWANRQWIDFVYARPDPETRPRELLGHVMVSERVWFERITGEPEAGTGTAFPVLTREELLRGLEENRATFERLIATRLEDVVHFRRATGREYHARVADILLQLITHGYHHRGQLAAHYARAGAAYPSTDHIDYLMENRI